MSARSDVIQTTVLDHTMTYTPLEFAQARISDDQFRAIQVGACRVAEPVGQQL